MSRFSIPKPSLALPNLRWFHARQLFKGLAIVLLAAIAGYGGAWAYQQQSDNQILGSDLSNQKRIVTNESRIISQIARTVGPSVVSVNVEIEGEGSSVYGLRTQGGLAAGTGIIISDKGLVMTNRHVVSDASNVSITLSDGTELTDISIVGQTNDSDSLDVAILKINDAKGKRLKPAVLGDSSMVQVGDNVIAIGNALGQFQNTVTSGIVSGFGRSVQASDGSSGYGGMESLDNLFQTDAAINEGNSGGPLVNLNGQVIGLNTAIAGGDAQNIGFAIPINDIRGLIRQVIKTGKLSRPYLGVRYVPLSEDVATEYELKTNEGAYIIPSQDQFNSSILSDGPAAKAGLREGDIITHVNDKKVDQAHSLTSLLGAYQPAERVKLTILRDNKKQTVRVTLGTMPGTE